MKVMVTPNVVSPLHTVTKKSIKRLADLEIKGQVDIILTTALLRLARIVRIVLDT